jgi:hypothetical protein
MWPIRAFIVAIVMLTGSIHMLIRQHFFSRSESFIENNSAPLETVTPIEDTTLTGREDRDAINLSQIQLMHELWEWRAMTMTMTSEFAILSAFQVSIVSSHILLLPRRYIRSRAIQFSRNHTTECVRTRSRSFDGQVVWMRVEAVGWR